MAANKFMNGNAKTLAHTILAKLFKGNSYISLLPYASTGVDWSTADFGGADEIFTLQDTFEIPQEDPSSTDIKIDQKSETIDTQEEPGAWNFNGTIPANCTEVLEVFYNKVSVGSTGVSVKGQEGTSYTGETFGMTPKSVYATILVESEDKKEAIAFAKVKLTAKMTRDTDSGLLAVALSGTILANDAAGQGDFYRGSAGDGK